VHCMCVCTVFARALARKCQKLNIGTVYYDCTSIDGHCILALLSNRPTVPYLHVSFELHLLRTCDVHPLCARITPLPSWVMIFVATQFCGYALGSCLPRTQES
jgi:hypothetical protein